MVQICRCKGDMTRAQFDCALEDAYQGGQLDQELRSQMNLARATVLKFGEDEAKFRIEFRRCYGIDLTEEASASLFGFYATAAPCLPVEDTSTSRNRKHKRKAAADATPDAEDATPACILDDRLSSVIGWTIIISTPCTHRF